MNNIKFTENVEEMIKIGKEIVESKPTTYTKRMCGIIMKTIDENMPKANDSEKQNVFYRSIYDYWVYGTNVAEEFYFDFLHKTHEQKLEYVTNKNRFLYINHLNDKNYSYLLNDKYEAYKLLKPYYKRDVIQIKSEADYEVFSDFVDKHPIFVAKPAALGLAIGVHKVNLADYPDKMTLMRELLVEGQEADKNYVWGGQALLCLKSSLNSTRRLRQYTRSLSTVLELQP